METGLGKTVCVTGGSGYVASWLIKLLLQRGYTVRATLRNLNDEGKSKHLFELEGAKERLHLFEADLLKESSFDSAIHGCHGVFHTASPCDFVSQNPQVELIEPAVKGTINVLNSCAKSASVKRVVLTSSAAAMLFNGKPISDDTVADETWFSDLQYCTDAKIWYGVAKTLAEHAAWKLAKEKGIDLITTLAGVTIGPLLQPTLNFSSNVIGSLINNEAGSYVDSRMVWIHVKDMAYAHVLLLENPLASGRYALVESCASFSEVVRTIHELYPTLPLPNKCEDGGLFPDVAAVSKEKMKTMGMNSYISLKEGIKDTIESLREKNLITI